jgi:hypothetical protein
VLARLEMAASLGFSFAGYGPYAKRVGEALRSERHENG